jgi:hypothetical protein
VIGTLDEIGEQLVLAAAELRPEDKPYRGLPAEVRIELVCAALKRARKKAAR